MSKNIKEFFENEVVRMILLIFEEYQRTREFDTLKSKKVSQSLETGLFFVKFLFLLYSNSTFPADISK